MASLDRLTLETAYQQVAATLQAQALPAGHWSGELAASALSTATAIAAISLAGQFDADLRTKTSTLVTRGLAWLAEHQNEDGGWGDTVLSHSNIATSMLARAALVIAEAEQTYPTVLSRAVDYIDRQGGVQAVHARYGRDRTFSAPILTQCALAGLVDWREVAALPFELACLPHDFYKFVKLPVVSYALPALIAIGQVRAHFAPSWNPLLRGLRTLARRPSLRKLEQIQPESGGFLEATPLTSFVVMSLAGVGESRHPVARLGLQFLQDSVRPDGSWPIDTNLATWVTTLATNGLEPETLPESQQLAIAEWLLSQQLQTVHPYTNAAPGGWAWTNLSGGVPDADDTSGAVLAMLKLARWNQIRERCHQAAANGVHWLLDLQNRDGGWPTFCKGWGALPFDRSSADITAHALRALSAFRKLPESRPSRDADRIPLAIERGLRYLARKQRADGSWLPLWFGNQHAPHEENPLYGTSRVLLAYRDLGLTTSAAAQQGLSWLNNHQNADGGWGGQRDCPSSVEETSLALEALCMHAHEHASARERGLAWLLSRIQSGTITDVSPIGFYFAKLWYFERLYPLVFAASALRTAAALPDEIPARLPDLPHERQQHPVTTLG